LALGRFTTICSKPMNLTPREQDRLDSIVQAISYEDRLSGRCEVSVVKLASFLARMEGSKEETCKECESKQMRSGSIHHIADPNCAFHGIELSTPPSEEKKCCDNIGGKNTHWQDCPFTASPTPPDTLQIMDEKSNVDWNKLAPPDAWEEDIRAVLREAYNRKDLGEEWAVSELTANFRTKKKEWEKYQHDLTKATESLAFLPKLRAAKEEARTTTLEDLQKVVEEEMNAAQKYVFVDGAAYDGKESVSQYACRALGGMKSRLLTHLKEMRTK
jgi:hypothetical protein